MSFPETSQHLQFGGPQTQPTAKLSDVDSLLGELLRLGVIGMEDWEEVSSDLQSTLIEAADSRELLFRLVAMKLLTPFQQEQMLDGRPAELIVGSYRLLDRIGRGGMGEVYLGEHIYLRRKVAIKMLTSLEGGVTTSLRRFLFEARAVANLRHPNIVSVLDFGENPHDQLMDVKIPYFVMDFVAGESLEKAVRTKGPFVVGEVLQQAYQIASALAEVHRCRLVHRDVKPSNIIISSEDGRAMLVDFGVVRHNKNSLTETGVGLGTIDYMAPEQAFDARGVDIRADIYALGASIYFSLTGQGLIRSGESPISNLLQRGARPAPSVREIRPEVPEALDRIIRQMMAPKPAERYSTPRDVMTALRLIGLPSPVDLARQPTVEEQSAQKGADAAPDRGAPAARRRILVVDDDALIRTFCRRCLENETTDYEEATNGTEALAMVRDVVYDVIVLDLGLPDLDGMEVLPRIRQIVPDNLSKILLISGNGQRDQMAACLANGADDFIEKPFSVEQLRSRTAAALRLKDAQDQAARIQLKLLEANEELERGMAALAGDRNLARKSLAIAIARVAERRFSETIGKLTRLSRWARCLTEQARLRGVYRNEFTPEFIDMIETCAPLRDLGNVGLPDNLLLKPGRYDDEERMLMQSHALVGEDLIRQIAGRAGGPASFLLPAAVVARHHHERFDGAGYPDGLAGEQIPLPARVVAIVDVYNALRTPRTYRPGLPHSMACRMLLDSRHNQFDPKLLSVFVACAADFERIHEQVED